MKEKEKTLTKENASIEDAKTQYDERQMEKAKRKPAGWLEGFTDRPPAGSAGWLEGTGIRPQGSEGWVEGMAKRTPRSKGWTEGYEHKN